MTGPALFVGVVSHEGSRFAVSQGPTGLAHHLEQALPGTVVAVNTANLLDEATLPVTPRMAQATLTAELRLDREWANYLGRTLGLRWWAVHAMRWARRGWLRLRPPGPHMVSRLLNIEFSHLDLMRRGLASGAPWVLIIEDDGFAPDISDLSTGLAGLMAADPSPAYVNVSESFTTEQLGIDHLLRPVAGQAWAGAVPRSIVQADRPITNTVCAILYSAPFLADLVKAMDSLPVEPVVPIDWKLNLALMRMFESGQIGPGDCWLVEPAPIRQMSMQPAGILPG